MIANLRSQLGFFAAILLSISAPIALGGEQKYEPLSVSVRASLHESVADQASPRLTFASETEGAAWLAEMSKRLEKYVGDRLVREELLITTQYEATRAGLDPQLVLGVIQVESRFRKHAVSKAGARGYMQVMPFWVELIGTADQNLFNLRTNLRYGCTILRHYLDMERGNIFRALGRYNGSLGKSVYPQKVRRAWKETWDYGSPGTIISPARYLGTN
ncbi:MAG: lytic transglycosylase domain-containing protein [Burkholderiales bacterium]